MLFHPLHKVRDKIQREEEENKINTYEQFYDVVAKVDDIILQRDEPSLFETHFGIHLSRNNLVLVKISDTSNILMETIVAEDSLPHDIKVGNVVRICRLQKGINKG